MIQTLSELMKDIKNGTIYNLYLLHGDELYLKEQYRNLLIEQIKAQKGNYTEVVKISEGIAADDLYEITETSSMFGNIKILIIYNSGWFKNDAKDSFEKYGFLTNIKDYLYIIFLEENIAKNKKIYKETEKNGVCVELSSQSDDTKIKWLEEHFSNQNITAPRNVLQYMVENCEKDFMNLSNEIEKLFLAKNSRDKLTIQDIDMYCTKIINSKIFDLTNAISGQDTKRALKALHDLQNSGEAVEKIYYTLSRYFRLIKQIKELIIDGNSRNASSILQIKPYEASKLISGADKFTLSTLKEAEYDCLNYDVLMKNGELNNKNALELLIIKYCTKSP